MDIEADEDHVSLQFHERKGDLIKNNNGQKNNCQITKLVYVHEGIEPEAPQSKRYKLINPHYFCRVCDGKDNEAFWDEVYVLSGKLNDALSGRLFCADFRTLQMCQSL